MLEDGTWISRLFDPAVELFTVRISQDEHFFNLVNEVNRFFSPLAVNHHVFSRQHTSEYKQLQLQTSVLNYKN